MNDSDLTDFFDVCYGDTTGYLHIAVGEGPRWVDDKYGHEHWTQTHFAYPAERDRAVREITRAAATGADVYICPNLMHADKRAQGAAVARMIVHSDVDDGRYDPEKVKAVGGFAVASGTPGNAHVYIPLTESVPANAHRELCRGLSRRLGAVDPKIADNDLLRPPGTFNHKAAARGGQLTPVRLLSSPNGRVAPAVVAELFGVELADPAVGTGRRGATEHAGAPVNLDRYPSVRKTLERRTKDRSADTYRVVAVCHRVGLTLAETTWVIRLRDDLKERLDERGDDDLLVIWLKLDDEARTVRRAEPPSAPVADGAELLDAVHKALTKFVVFPSKTVAVGATLWTAATHALPAWQHATRLVVKSPQKRCGKSRLLDLARLLCCTPLMSTDLSTAAIYRSIGDDDYQTPTLLIDEADALFGTKNKAEQNEDLRGLLNAGFQRDRPVMRCVGPNQEPTEFNTFAMCALAAIKALPDTVVERAVTIDLKRRRSGETVARFRIRRDTPPLLELRARLTAWVREGERLAQLGDAEPPMPDSIEDRAQDAWEPLIAIADAAGGHWPKSARTACVELCGQADGIDDDDIQLLADIEDVFASLTRISKKYSRDADVEFVASIQLVRELKEHDESPWRDNELTPHKLAKMLRPFGVRPRQSPDKALRGYWRGDFDDPFRRYIRPDRPNRPRDESDQQEQGENK